MLRIVRAVARVASARPLALRAAAPARVAFAPAAFGLSASRQLAQSFRSSAVFAADGDAPSSRPQEDRSNQLFVGNIPFDVDDAQLTSTFSAYGCQEGKIIYDQATGRSKGIAFLTFPSAEQANQAQQAMNGAELSGRNIRVETRQPPGERRPFTPREQRAPRERRPQANDDRKLFVGNLAWAVDGLDLEDIFKEFGTVESAQVITDRETGRSRGFGFVIMSTKEESAAAASELGGANIDGRKIVVEFASEKAKAA